MLAVFARDIVQVAMSRHGSILTELVALQIHTAQGQVNKLFQPEANYPLHDPRLFIYSSRFGPLDPSPFAIIKSLLGGVALGINGSARGRQPGTIQYST